MVQRWQIRCQRVRVEVSFENWRLQHRLILIVYGSNDETQSTARWTEFAQHSVAVNHTIRWASISQAPIQPIDPSRFDALRFWVELCQITGIQKGKVCARRMENHSGLNILRKFHADTDLSFIHSTFFLGIWQLPQRLLKRHVILCYVFSSNEFEWYIYLCMQHNDDHIVAFAHISFHCISRQTGVLYLCTENCVCVGHGAASGARHHSTATDPGQKSSVLGRRTRRRLCKSRQTILMWHFDLLPIPGEIHDKSSRRWQRRRPNKVIKKTWRIITRKSIASSFSYDSCKAKSLCNCHLMHYLLLGKHISIISVNCSPFVCTSRVNWMFAIWIGGNTTAERTPHVFCDHKDLMNEFIDNIPNAAIDTATSPSNLTLVYGILSFLYYSFTNTQHMHTCTHTHAQTLPNATAKLLSFSLALSLSAYIHLLLKSVKFPVKCLRATSTVPMIATAAMRHVHTLTHYSDRLCSLECHK